MTVFAEPPLSSGLIPPVFHTGAAAKRAADRLPDLFLPTYCFKEDVRGEKPRIARA